MKQNNECKLKYICNNGMKNKKIHTQTKKKERKRTTSKIAESDVNKFTTTSIDIQIISLSS